MLLQLCEPAMGRSPHDAIQFIFDPAAYYTGHTVFRNEVRQSRDLQGCYFGTEGLGKGDAFVLRLDRQLRAVVRKQNVSVQRSLVWRSAASCVILYIDIDFRYNDPSAAYEAYCGALAGFRPGSRTSGRCRRIGAASAPA